MKPLLGLIFGFFLILSGCSEKTSEPDNDVVDSQLTNDSPPAGREEGFAVVCGILYQVNDFSHWFEEYKKVAESTIIILRNVDDPSLVVVYEGEESLELAKERGVALTDEEFLINAGIEGTPVPKNHKVQYFKPPTGDFKQHVGLTFDSPDIKMVISRLERDSDLFATYGLSVMGVGTNMENEEEVYVLLTLEDFVSFRQRTNSPGKIRKFNESLNLPSETIISDWTKTVL